MKGKKKPSNNGKSLHRVGSRDPSPIEILKLLDQEQIPYLDLIPRESLEEKIVHLVLEGQGPWKDVTPSFDSLLSAVQRFPTGGVRTVVFGGGTGLSSILGGDTAQPAWPLAPFGGLKRIFPKLSVAVCTTDDGGSSGRLLRYLRCIAPGDLRRALLSSITPRHILGQYPSLQVDHLETVAGALRHILNYRFGRVPRPTYLKNPSRLLTSSVRKSVPQDLLDYLDALGSGFLQDPLLGLIPLEGQCFGNMLLLSSIYSVNKLRTRTHERTGKRKDPNRYAPSPEEILLGIQAFAERIGAGRETIFPACATQGELQVLYAHGVLSAGEAKSARGHSSFPVQRVWVHLVETPHTSPDLIKKIEEADLILLAPGSLYTSIIPILQIPQLADAVRRNRNAVKILGMNFWAQRGETDISVRRPGKEYHVSDMIEAYQNNIPGGIQDLFDTLIVTDLRSIPGDILRNYALEGKVPIYLDKQRVRAMGLDPVEAAVFSEEKLRNEKVIQHDPEKFAIVVKTLYSLQKSSRKTPRTGTIRPSLFDPNTRFPRKGFLCEYWNEVSRKIDGLHCVNTRLKRVMKEVIWNNREILLEHLDYLKGIQLIRKKQWKRSTEWDNILGYYEPEDGYLKIHEDLLRGPDERLTEDLLIALGESLLGNYYKSKAVHEILQTRVLMGKVFEVQLLPKKRRRSFLSDQELREYLHLAQLRPHPDDPDRFSMLINDNEAFTPPGLLFGLLYAWYVNNRFGGIVDYEMSLLRWRISELIPKPSMERSRMQNRIEFFRRSVFRQHVPCTADDL